MMNKLIELEKRMIRLFEESLDIDGHCKSGEPALTITIHNDLTWSAENLRNHFGKISLNHGFSSRNQKLYKVSPN